MLFQTVPFLYLMLAVLLGVVLIRTRTLQLVMILVASWVFYATWDPRFLILLLGCTVNDYLLGLAIGRAGTPATKRFWLVVSLITNLGVLAIFKYADFFAGSVNDLVAALGGTFSLPLAHLTLPVGISFYTFHSMGYNIDVYRGKSEPERSFLRFAIYVAFFPQLVAGPILRAGQFLPQLRKTLSLEPANLRSGAHLFLVGLVKKVAIADNVSPIADHVMNAPRGLPSLAIWIGAVAFAVQIYCDFSGYTDMARGVSRMLGLEIPINFNYPYLSTSITEFWKRWHISLSSWLRDYLYISLGGNRGGTAETYRNLMATMTLGGLWHGASWNFLLWGGYQGAILAIERALGVADVTPETPWARRALRHAVCLYLVLLGWILFRAQNLGDLSYCVTKFVVFDGKLGMGNLGLGAFNPFVVALAIAAFAVLHLVSRRVGGLAHWLDTLGPFARAIAVTSAVVTLILCWPTGMRAFIYFQF